MSGLTGRSPVSYLLALNAASGMELWKVARDEKSNSSTPFVCKHKLRTEFVTAGTGRIRSYDTDDRLLWELAGMSSIAVPTPFVGDGLLYRATPSPTVIPVPLHSP